MIMRRDPLSGLHVFMNAVAFGSFTRAAAVLGVTPAAISLSIGQLESDLKMKLFSRSTRGVTLTEAGQHYYQDTVDAYRRIVEARDASMQVGGEPAGQLRITALRLAKTVLTRDFLAEFVTRYPKVALEIRYEDRFVDIVRERLDAGVRLEDQLQAGMIGVKLTPKTACALVASPVYLARFGTPERIADLEVHARLGYRFSESGRLHKWPLRAGDEAVDVDPGERFVATDTEAVIDAARAGLGIAFVTGRERIEADLHDGTLREILPGASRPLPPMWLYYANRKHVPTKLGAFITLLREFANRG
ncbi:LysR family transcriptional regulator [Burkholderia lata]|uniref:LysR family transcriptional regulator n=1 Tax=Burkholderia lata (strain ATCC 17760 / DSM 23089 / LMG 22485 / NCIMB 9086 / R18194 / 383) TaxID=482957 RepID=A0A6P2T725_BURL3|nr:LysR family transcriptional regulator [Burkholderia lata]VWC57019.1 LysR family transcriptional regulator [Burkholderia lata]VWC59276.1 LysR family transcriptional regulator [Burkholderia lata]